VDSARRDGMGDYCETEDFDAVNLFAGLAEDPLFNQDSLPVHRLPFQYRRQTAQMHSVPPKIFKRTLPVTPPLSVSLQMVNSVPNKCLMALSLKTLLDDKAAVTIQRLNTEMSDCIISSMGAPGCPLELKSWDCVSLLYSVTSMGDLRPGLNASGPQRDGGRSNVAYPPADFGGSGSAPGFLSVSLDLSCSLPGTRGQRMSSRWHVLVEPRLLGSVVPHVSLSLSPGRRFLVPPPLPLPLPTRLSRWPSSPAMEYTGDLEVSFALLDFRASSTYRETLAHLHFVAVGGDFHTLDTVEIIDDDTGDVACISDYLTIYIA
ncbi:hypothetical protein HK405_005248, partial [Cladochytrium tenue]